MDESGGVAAMRQPIISQALFIPGPLPGMNDFAGTGTRWKYRDAKAAWARAIAFEILQQRLKPMGRVFIWWVWYEKTMKRDPDNFSSIGKKFVLDALKSAGIVPNDGWKHIAGWADRWEVSAERPGVLVKLEASE